MLQRLNPTRPAALARLALCALGAGLAFNASAQGYGGQQQAAGSYGYASNAPDPAAGPPMPSTASSLVDVGDAKATSWGQVRAAPTSNASQAKAQADWASWTSIHDKCGGLAGNARSMCDSQVSFQSGG